jgi:hypothetical protein
MTAEPVEADKRPRYKARQCDINFRQTPVGYKPKGAYLCCTCEYAYQWPEPIRTKKDNTSDQAKGC